MSLLSCILNMALDKAVDLDGDRIINGMEIHISYTTTECIAQRCYQRPQEGSIAYRQYTHT